MSNLNSPIKPTANSGPVLISDFDGTMTRHDFYKLAIERLLPADTRSQSTGYLSAVDFFALRRRRKNGRKV